MSIRLKVSAKSSTFWWRSHRGSARFSPASPDTATDLEAFALLDRLQNHSGIDILQPLGYLENLALMRRATLVLTDSGGIQEETSYLSIPCLTLRENTERPATVAMAPTRWLAGTSRRLAVCLRNPKREI